MHQPDLAVAAGADSSDLSTPVCTLRLLDGKCDGARSPRAAQLHRLFRCEPFRV